MAKTVVYKNSLDGSSPIYKEIAVNDNQTIKIGDIVVISSGKASIAADAAGAATVLGISNTAIVTTTAAATDVIRYDANPNSIYNMAYIGTGTVTVGVSYDMGGAAYQFDSDDTTGGYIKVHGNIDTTAKRADVVLMNRVF